MNRSFDDPTVPGAASLTRTNMTTSDSQWRILAASARGASHLHSDAPNQDAQRSQPLSGLDKDALVVAVADGHGDRRHFRSERGSRFAVESACRCATDATRILGEAPSTNDMEERAKAALVSPIVDDWRSTVAEDVARDPFNESELALLKDLSATPELAYGSTLLIALLWGQHVLLAQIGDGSAVVLHLDGDVGTPVPGDARLDGRQTTSLCQPDATDAFRVAAIDRTKKQVGGILLATDGFGNAQIADPWEPAVGLDLVDMARHHGLDWIEQQLPTWVDECASAAGSADDATVALILTTENWAHAPGRPSTQLEDTATTEWLPATEVIPGPPRSRTASDRRALPSGAEETVPVSPPPTMHRPTSVGSSDRPPGGAQQPSSSLSRRTWIAVTAVVVAVLLLAFLLLRASGPSRPRSPSTSTPSTTTVNTTPATNSPTTPFGQRHSGITGSTGGQSPATSPSISSGTSPTSTETSSTTTSTFGQSINHASSTPVSPFGRSGRASSRQ